MPSHAMKDEDERRLTGIFRRLFHDPGLELRAETTARDVPGWDSLNHVTLVVEIEREFGVRFASSEIAVLRSVGELRALLDSKLGS